jgi:Aspartyl protease
LVLGHLSSYSWMPLFLEDLLACCLRTVDSKPARFLFDSGASAVFVSHAYACRLGLELQPWEEEVKFADGSSLRVWGMCCSPATIQGYSWLVEAYGVELSSTYGVILGAT